MGLIILVLFCDLLQLIFKWDCFSLIIKMDTGKSNFKKHVISLHTEKLENLDRTDLDLRILSE